jgi:uncharacterized protein HemX
MENKLKQLAMGLRARPAAEQRTVAVCAAALVLSSEARHATAMVAGKSLGAGGAKFTMSHGSVPAVRALISAIKTGGVTMASTKTVIAVGAALALAAGGYYYYEQEHENSTPAVSGAAEMERQKQIDDQRHRAEDERRKKDELRRQEEQRARSTPTKP